MTLIFCLDKNNGMLFGGRRQTFDYEVLDLICNIGGERLYITPFSQKYFGERSYELLGEGLKGAPSDAAVFLEDRDALPYISRVEKIIIYRWDKVYPADRWLGFSPLDEGFRLSGKVKFSTEVHKDIVKEIYKR